MISCLLGKEIQFLIIMGRLSLVVVGIFLVSKADNNKSGTAV